MSKKRSKSVNISSTCVVKAKCKHCNTFPTNYYFTNRFYSKQFRKQLGSKFFSSFKRMCSDYYFSYDPSSYNSINYFNYGVSYKFYNPRLFKNNRNELPVSNEHILVCYCGRSTWSFYDTSPHTQFSNPEIFHRKGKYNFPKNFKY